MTVPRVLVTGASGFLGSHVVAKLCVKGFPVRAVSRRGVTLPGAETFQVESYTEARSLEPALRGVDSVVHLAGLAHTPPWARDWSAVAWNHRLDEAHVLPAEAVARTAIREGVRRLVYVSSLAALASSSSVPVGPQTSPRPSGGYGRAKLLAEERLREICRGSGVGLVILRPPMIYGRDAPGNASRLAGWIRRGGPVPVPSRPNARSLLFVKNFLSLLQKILEFPETPPWPVLVQDDRPVSTEELACLMGQALGRPARIWRIPSACLGVLGHRVLAEKLWGNLAVDSSQTEEFYRWEPPVKVEEGIRHSFGTRS